MGAFLLRRVGQSLILLLLVSIIGFAALNLAPGGPLSQYALTPGMTQEAMQRIATQMGLNRPLPVQYFDWLSHLLRGDWGRSYRDGQPVLSIIFSHLPATLLLMCTSMVFSIAIGVWIGIQSAIKRDSLFDRMATMGAMVALSIPTFWFGLVAIYFFALKLQWLPAGNMYTVGDGSLLDVLRHLILPVLVLTFVDVAIWSRYMRTATLEVINQDFIKTARAKGVAPRRVLLKHVVGNALLPMITLAGMQLPTILGGALVAETVFTWPGMGRLFLDSLGYSDYPVVMGLLMCSAILVLIGNLLADVITALVDPRIRPA
ncbi:ABC transporter permease [Erwiniaceae bacterium L1_54_6]|jgi:peptide/nickel transport system permease protein|uniref:Diguanylate cyclase n=1 Tax=Pantoea cypripedii TaxID=55209 RepID=A0A6B9FZC2_PANCY|nr:ABC transporter permease [Pantoea cypripedii]MDF7658663.1 ABC transporter permease [Erwiniaceae bacterium L1_54_6]QGY29632.1 diguanylate cyclase [Pantoea cypripedii]